MATCIYVSLNIWIRDGKSDVQDVLEVLDELDSEFDELASGDSDDGWLDDNYDVDSDNESSPDKPREDLSPYRYFKRFVNDDMFANLAMETNNYAHQKLGISLQTTAEKLETVTGMYFSMGLVKMPVVGGYWKTDTRYTPVADMMSRNRFQKITLYFHITNNLLATDAEKENRAWKLRPWLRDLNANFAKLSPGQNQCVDEIMMTFKRRSLLKQYLPKKPKKLGFKLWARCAATGFLHAFDIYQGRCTGMGTDTDLPGHADCMRTGGNVVLKLCSSLPEKHNFKIFADNFISDFQMIHELRKKGFFYTGTININRVHDRSKPKRN
ncbi:PREDICTED: piggyBac transposable element-derived protein 3-like [Priapulus caudatus]|uniref:PiggyBac transposable element-derived protein 3-like n=1 Tax=Priapulus caudatus TaxID=37621 RepID=A0ABM1EJZ5_PRICU|nr:PREDICTED: piggyBac transposable element-derived protein 3-like [Priapulus caudatus]